MKVSLDGHLRLSILLPWIPDEKLCFRQICLLPKYSVLSLQPSHSLDNLSI